MFDVINGFIDNAPVTLIAALIAFIVIDYATGLMRALYECKSNSKTHYKGIIKKLGIIVGVIVGAIADIILSDSTPMFTTMVTMLFIAGEVLSIIENLGVMGVTLPKALADRFEQIHQNDGEVTKVTEYDVKIEEKVTEKSAAEDVPLDPNEINRRTRELAEKKGDVGNYDEEHR